MTNNVHLVKSALFYRALCTQFKKQFHSIKQGGDRISDANFIKYKTKLNSDVKQL